MTTDDLDAYLRLLSDRHRRRIIHRLRNEPTDEATVADLVDYLHGSESITVTGRRTDHDQLAIQLTHNHLPKLVEHGVVTIDPESETVRYQSDEQLETILDSLPGEVAQVDL